MSFDVKKEVKKFYGGIAKNVSKGSKKSCCSSSSCCGDISSSSIIYKGENFADIPKDAIEASLGCANPVVFANLKEGEIVLDLGSGGGINVLMASKYVGVNGKVYGLDMTEEMLTLANKNKEKMGVSNVEFIKGYIEDIPLPDNSVDVIISNCVINLSDDKEKALAEAYRVLKPGGRLAIADIITIKDIDSQIKQLISTWVGCLGGTLKSEEYNNILDEVGFKNIEINAEHIYTKSVIKENFLNDKNMGKFIQSINLDAVDGAFAGAYIKATKE